MMLFFVILWSVVRHFPKNEICYFSNPVLLDIERNSSKFFNVHIGFHQHDYAFVNKRFVGNAFMHSM